MVLSVANDKSIAWSVAKRLAAEGAHVLVGVQSGRFVERVEALIAREAPEVAALMSVAACDVSDEADVAAFVDACGPSCDAIVHSLAFASRGAMRKPFLECSASEFGEALGVSAHSLASLTRHAAPKLGPGASVVTMSYLGAHRAATEYNVMGPAKAALEASVRQLAVELGMLGDAATRSPLRREVTREEVASATAFLASDMASGITGQTLYVDCGFSAAM